MADFFGIAESEKIQKSGVREIFTPHEPVKIQELLFGRGDVVKKIVTQIDTPGAYPILFGDRGVGKTSISSIILTLVQVRKPKNKTCFVDLKRCSSKETLATIFKTLLKHCDIDTSLLERNSVVESGGKAGIGTGFINADIGSKRIKSEKFGSGFSQINSSFIAEAITANLNDGLLIIDEADAIENEAVKYELAEIIKLLSDAHSKFKIMLVGVAELSKDLTAGHKSIGRCAVETKLERISDTEIRKIISVGATKIKPKMEFDNDVIKSIASMANGYPYFAHLCGLKCVEDALAEGRKFIRSHHLPKALVRAAEEAEQSLRGVFNDATSSPTTPMYKKVVFSASEFGCETFSAADLRRKIEEHTGAPISQSALNNLFKKLVSEDYSKIFHRVSKGNYKFSDPRMPSFAKIANASGAHYPNKQ